MKRILIVEDHPELRDILRDIIENKYPSYEIDLSQDEQTALSTITLNTNQPNTKDYDFIIVDIKLNDHQSHLDDFGGLRILDHINHNLINSKVIVVTAHADKRVCITDGKEISVCEYSQQNNVHAFFDRMQLGSSYYDELLKIL